jgi:hypothetical protein
VKLPHQGLTTRLAPQVLLLPLPGRRHPARLLGVAAATADWATRQPLHLPVLCR